MLERAVAFFGERGYRAGRTGRPGQVFVLGKAEGSLPRVTGEVAARANVGKPGTTLVTLDAAGERLGPAMADFARSLRPPRPTSGTAQTASASPSSADPNPQSPTPDPQSPDPERPS